MKPTFRRILLYAFLCIVLIGMLNYTGVNSSIAPTKLETVVKSNISSVVHIRHSHGWQGSGVLVSKDGIILTARHIIGDGGEYAITLNDGTEYKSTTAIKSKKHDVGFIKIDAEGDLSFSHIKGSSNLRRGQSIFMIGSPFGKDFFNSVTSGIISGIRETDYFRYGWYTLIQTDAAGNPGNSGCPIFNLSGKIIGIVVGGPTRSYAGITLCIQSDTFKDMLNKVKLMFSMNDLEFVGNKYVGTTVEDSPLSFGKKKVPMEHVLDRMEKACVKCHE